MMLSYVLIFLTALTFAILGTPLARHLAMRLGVVDLPSARKVHLTPVPLLGGVAVYVAFGLALLFFQERYQIPQLVGIFLGATVVSFLGIWDDRKALRPLIKLLGQFLAAGLLLYSGVQVNLFPWRWLNLAVSAFWVVGITNAFNLLDNMDGLSGGVGAVASAFFLLLSAMSGQYLVGSLAAALMGACLGFLSYNFNPAAVFAPASIFLGDSGALFLGFILAAVGIKLRFPSNSFLVTWMIPVVVLWLPIFDTSLVVLSRLRHRRNPLTNPGKDHLSHRLVARGFSRREAVLLLYLACGAVGVLAMFLSQAGALEAYIVGGGLAMVSLVALWRLERGFRPPGA